MFKVNPDGMRMEPTPERVLSVCRLIAHKSMTRDEVRKAMTLGINDEKELDQINKSSEKVTLGELPVGSWVLIGLLAFCWISMLIYVGINKIKKKN